MMTSRLQAPAFSSLLPPASQTRTLPQPRFGANDLFPCEDDLKGCSTGCGETTNSFMNFLAVGALVGLLAVGWTSCNDRKFNQQAASVVAELSGQAAPNVEQQFKELGDKHRVKIVLDFAAKPGANLDRLTPDLIARIENADARATVADYLAWKKNPTPSKAEQVAMAEAERSLKEQFQLN